MHATIFVSLLLVSFVLGALLKFVRSRVDRFSVLAVTRVARSRPVERPAKHRRGHLIGGFVGATLAGCDAGGAPNLPSSLVSLGITDAPILPPVAIAVVCDSTEGSPCERGSVQTLVSRAVDTAFGRPGSTVRVVVLGATPGETRHVATLTTPPAAERSARAARLARERFLATVEATLCPGLDATLTRSRPRASHIVEALDEVALARDPHLPLVILAMSDGREVSALGDFECRALPSADAFRARLAVRNLLVRGSFTGSFVTFVVGDRGPVLRRDCPVSMGRERQVQALWSGALLAAGARDVRFVADLPSEAELTTLYGAVSQDGGVR